MRTRRPGRTRNRKLYGLYAARMRAGITGAELARMSGVTPATISRCEYLDHAAKPETIIKLARALRVDPGVLVRKPGGGEEEG